MYRILITGANGQLGSEFRRIAPSAGGSTFTFTDIGELDILDEKALSAFFSARTFDCIINCAGYTAVDKAETEREQAMQVNAAAVRNLALAAGEQHALLVHMSTDYVFDGHHYQPYRETDRENPTSWYGQTKLEGERQVLMHAGKAIIIRTSWLYSSFGNNFLKTMIRLGREKNEVRVVCDQIGTPTRAADLARSVLSIIPLFRWNEKRIYHYSNEGVCSWYDFATEIMETAGLSCRMVPVTTAEYPAAARRPFYSVLDKSKIKKDFGIEIPHWKKSLKECIRELRKEGE